MEGDYGMEGDLFSSRWRAAAVAAARRLPPTVRRSEQRTALAAW